MRRNSRAAYDDLARALDRFERPQVRMTGSTTAGGVDEAVKVNTLPLPLGSVGDVLTVATDGTDTVPAWAAPTGGVTLPIAESDVTGLVADLAALSAASHAAATVLDSSSIDFSISGQQITGAIVDAYVQALIDASVSAGQYRQYVVIPDGAGGFGFVDDGFASPVYTLEDLE